ncbi:MAG: TIGR04282 family arsenosugar biosynthesis glycosyltransferase [Simplicispira suum]|uniref:TIGR04282 family arsenosugar biosynthesis glycosyltransferase n=1 Tax=Simplicispira suum TaxID=2109915 RepID=UPI001C6B9AB9|nr:TIGR04282 family arsenosugar biosynthesis glycosyltransferase [Simplicispira suum]MBW7833002.1 TIGR04282 family arsenosugar biosynthesis glycosyltransferase [Simplicispira suum]
MKPVRIVVIAKAPIVGFCKTRLIPALGEQGATELAQRMLVRTVATALAAGLGTVELCVTPGLQAFDWRGLDLPGGLVWSEQGEGDLGERMGRAAQRVTSAGEAILLIGTDCPELDSGLLQRAAAALQGHDACLVPTADGGYALLGLKRFDPMLFDAMPWSTDAVAAETRQRVVALNWRLYSLPTLHDIDEPEDLAWLPAELRAGLTTSTQPHP